jgi:hypothetical protein
LTLLEFSSGSKRRTASHDDSGELLQLIIGPFAFPRPHGINSSTSRFLNSSDGSVPEDQFIPSARAKIFNNRVEQRLVDI